MKQTALFPQEAQARPARRAFGLAWQGGTGRGAGFRPFQTWRTIKRGKNKGKVEVTFCSGKKQIIEPERVRIWPDPPPQEKGERSGAS